MQRRRPWSERKKKQGTTTALLAYSCSINLLLSLSVFKRVRLVRRFVNFYEGLNEPDKPTKNDWNAVVWRRVYRFRNRVGLRGRGERKLFLFIGHSDRRQIMLLLTSSLGSLSLSMVFLFLWSMISWWCIVRFWWYS